MKKPEFSKKWYVFYTYPKFEKKVHDLLNHENIESFLPLKHEVRQWSDRKKYIQTPLFPCYIFVKIERNKIFKVLKIPKIIRCVTFNKIPAYLKQEEIDIINRIMSNKYSYEVNQNLMIGTPILITEGALTGMKGYLVKEKGKNRFTVRIESLLQSIVVNVPATCLEPAEALAF